MILTNSKGGVLSFTSLLTLRLVERNYLLRLIFLNQAPKNKLPNSSNLKIFYLLPPSTVTIRRFINVISKNDSDLLQINFASFFPIALFRKIVFKTPYVLTLHGLPQPALEYSLKSKVSYSVECIMVRFALHYASATVCVSKYVQKLLKARYHSDSIVIYHGFDTKKIIKISKQEAKKQLGFKENDAIILFVGTLSCYKDPLTLLDGFSKVLLSMPAKLIMVGNGELSGKVNQTIEKLGIQNSVSLFETIPQEELTHCYNAADIFVLPTVNEAFGIVLLEAMAFGVPILASNTGACQEVAADAGIYFNQGDPSVLAEKILHLLKDKDLCNRLTEVGLARVKDKFSVEDVAIQYSSLFEKVLSSTHS
jgi:glycosyltransferase involved in cell wall biosynthesis